MPMAAGKEKAKNAEISGIPTFMNIPLPGAFAFSGVVDSLRITMPDR